MIVMLRVIHKRDEPIDILLLNRDNKSAVPLNPGNLISGSVHRIIITSTMNSNNHRATFLRLYLSIFAKISAVFTSTRGERSNRSLIVRDETSIPAYVTIFQGYFSGRRKNLILRFLCAADR